MTLYDDTQIDRLARLLDPLARDLWSGPHSDYHGTRSNGSGDLFKLN
jgi:hypothetical protein